MKKFLAGILSTAMIFEMGALPVALALEDSNTPNVTTAQMEVAVDNASLSTLEEAPFFVDQDESEQLPDDFDQEATNLAMNEFMESLSQELAAMPISNTATMRVDVAFLIDTTASMSAEISGVKVNIVKFAQYLISHNVLPRLSLVEYRDVQYNGDDSTVIHTIDPSSNTPWTTTSVEMQGLLDSLTLADSRDTAETPWDAFGAITSDSFPWSDSSFNFAILLTDAYPKVNNNYGFTGIDDVKQALIEKDIITSVLTLSNYQSYYEDLVDYKSGYMGVLSSNQDDYWDLLEQLGDRIIGVVEEEVEESKAIYVIPGYLNSQLYEMNYGEKLWMNETVALSIHPDRDLFYRNSDGTAGNTNLLTTVTKEFKEESSIPFQDYDKSGRLDGDEGIHEAMMSTLEDNFSQTHKIHFFPYDWVGDLNDSVDALEAHIEKNSYNSVTFITHSTGALIASGYIAKSAENKRNVEDSILIAAPLFGTYSAMYPINNGTAGSFLHTDLAVKVINNTWTQTIAYSSPTTHQLLPSAEYLYKYPLSLRTYELKDEFIGNYYPGYGAQLEDSSEDAYQPGYKYEDVVTTHSNIDDVYDYLLLDSDVNPALLTGSGAAASATNSNHQSFREDSLNGNIVNVLKPIDPLLIVGSSTQSTPTTAAVTLPFGDDTTGGISVGYRYSGDGTVTFYSATAGGQLDYKQITTGDISHEGLLANTEVLNDIVERIKDKTYWNSSNNDFIGPMPYTLSTIATDTEDSILVEYESNKNVKVIVHDDTDKEVASYTYDYILDKDSVSNPNNKYGHEIIVTSDGFHDINAVFEGWADEYASDVDLYNGATAYFLNQGYDVTFELANKDDYDDKDIAFYLEISTLTSDGFSDATLYQYIDSVDTEGVLFTLEGTEKIDNTTLKETYEKTAASDKDTSVFFTDFYTDWTISKTDYDFENFNPLEKSTDTVKLSITDANDSTNDGETDYLNWQSSDTSIVTVSSDGVVTPVNYGTAFVYAQVGSMYQPCAITVVREADSVDVDDLSLHINEGVLISPAFTPSVTTETALTYTGYDSDVVSIDNYGVVKGLAEGTTDVIATTSNGYSTAFTIEVLGDSKTGESEAVSSINGSSSITIGNSSTYSATVINVNDETVTWGAVDNGSTSLTVATMTTNSNNTVTLNALSEGTVKLTATSKGGYTHSILINLTEITVIPTYTVTFDANGGDVNLKTMETGSDFKLSSLPTPTLEGYTFEGWFTTKTGSTEVTTDYTFSRDRTIYAQWVEDITTYTVKFDALGGIDKSVYFTTDEDGYIEEFPTPTHETLFFDGWYLTQNGGTEAVTEDTIFTENTFLFARWKDATSYFGTYKNMIIAKNTSGSSYGGTVSSDNSNPMEGETVILTVNSSHRYTLSSISAVNSKGSSISLKKISDNQYSFVQPAYDLEITAIFQFQTG